MEGRGWKRDVDGERVVGDDKKNEITVLIGGLGMV